MQLPWLTLAIAAVLVAMTPQSFAQEAAASLIPNGGFERDEDGDGMADGWQFSGNESVTVSWSRDAGVEGQYSQKLECTAFEYTSPASHVMLAQVDTFALEEGQWYRISLWVKGEGIPGGAASVAIRQTAPWGDLGLNEAFRVRGEWEQVDFTFRSPKAISESIRLQIWFGSTGTIWVDDVKLVPAEPVVRRYTEALADLGSKNLIPNSSFECGTSGWGSITSVPGWGGNLNWLVGEVDARSAAQDSCSLQITVDRATTPTYYFDYFEMARQPVLKPLAANRGWISVEPGQEYTLSAYVKGDPPGTPCTMEVHQAAGGTISHHFEAPGPWERVSFVFQPRAKQLFVAIGPDLTESDLQRATVWIDGVQLEKGAEATEYEPRAPVEIGIDWPRPGHLFSAPEDVRATIGGFNATGEARSAHISAAVTDFFDEETDSTELELRLPARGAAERVLRPRLPGKGFYRVALSSDDGVVIPVRSERFAVIQPCEDGGGLFGMNHAYPWAELNRLSKQIGLTWFRDWSLKWLHVEPDKGRFDFSETDHQIDRVVDEGLNLLGLLPFPSSDWSSTAPPDATDDRVSGARLRVAYMPRDLDEFADYVRTTVRHYEGRIHAWEIMNEPIYTSYALPASKGYSVEDYVRLLEVAYRAAKEADPEAFVIGGIAGPPELRTQEFIDAGGLEWVDALNLHAYPGLRAPESYIAPLEELGKRMRQAGKRRPIWFTEGAYYADDDLPFEPYEAWLKPLASERDCAEYQVRFDVILLSHGVEKIIYHSGTPGRLNDEGVSGIFFEWDAAPRKMSAAQAQLTALLGPDTIALGSVSEETRAFAFHSRGKTVVLLWDGKAAGYTVAPAEEVTLLDICGSEVKGERVRLGETPYYMVMNERVGRDRARRVVARALEASLDGGTE
jgi:hypothetical protein